MLVQRVSELDASTSKVSHPDGGLVHQHVDSIVYFGTIEVVSTNVHDYWQLAYVNILFPENLCGVIS
jgi:hypothetical protein